MLTFVDSRECFLCQKDGGIMTGLSTGLLSTVILSPLFVHSAVVGDVDEDGPIEFSEAIYALQVASG